jgi:DNA-directed RNA polymerase subunit RPC12/RpoP
VVQVIHMPKVQIWGYRCERCNHEWVPREKDQEPKVCPHCKSPYWDKPRQTPPSRKTGAKKNPS